MNEELISRNNQEFNMWWSRGIKIVAKTIYKIRSPNINPFILVCLHGDLEMAQWLLEQNPNIDLYENYHRAFRYACLRSNRELAEWLRSLRPYKYQICYNAKGHIVNYNINSEKEERWQRRKYLVWLASNESPCKNNLFYKITEDVSRYIIQML